MEKTLLVLIVFCLNDFVARAEEAAIKYNLKWIYDEYPLPIWLEQPYNASIEAEYSWFKYSDDLFINEIENNEIDFSYTMTPEFNRLYIFTYNFGTHNQLSSYESKMISTRDETDTPLGTRQIFTLAYLKSHSIIVNNANKDTVDVSCAVEVLLPNNEHNEDFTANNYKLIEKYLKLQMSFDDESLEENKVENVNEEELEEESTNEDDQEQVVLIDKRHIKRKNKLKRNVEVGEQNYLVSLIEIEMRQGPYTRLKSDLRGKYLNCYISLTDFDEAVVYDKIIAKRFDHLVLNESVDYIADIKSNTQLNAAPRCQSNFVAYLLVHIFLFTKTICK